MGENKREVGKEYGVGGPDQLAKKKTERERYRYTWPGSTEPEVESEEESGEES